MSEARFIQIHSLHSYAAALLNRDDTGLAKRLPYGGVMRTRVSSQCLKRHWRLADDIHNVHKIEGAEESVRSRQIVSKKVIDDINASDEIKQLLEPIFQKAVYGDKGETLKGRQPLLLGDPEINWLRQQGQALADQAGSNVDNIKELATKWAKDFKSNIKAMRVGTQLPGGLTAALFGRMMTSDTEANIDAPIHVAHAFTVHEAEEESDYFSVAEDLRLGSEDAGAAHIGETDLNSGLFYSYVVVDVPLLVKNLGGDRGMSGQVIHNLIHLIAEVSPGAKLGSTAPYGYADLMLVEAGDRQPRSLSGAFRRPCKPDLEEAVKVLKTHLEVLDTAYQTGEDRRVMQISGPEITTPGRLSIPDLARWVEEKVKAGGAA